MAKTLEEKLWPKINKTDTCWLWLAALDTNGYGQFCIYGRPRKPAHKVVYELLITPVPRSMELDHLCRVRACVNPAHLEIVTSKENRRRGFGPDAVNRRKTHCIRGHAFNPGNTYVSQGHRACRQCKLTQYYENKQTACV